MISSFKDSKKMLNIEESWPRFETESFESPLSAKSREQISFVSLQFPDDGHTDFVPLVEGDFKKRKPLESTSHLDPEKIALLEQDAYEKGFAQGEKDGYELGTKKAIKVIEKIESLLIEMNGLKEDILTHHEKDILKLIFSIAEKVVYHHIGLDEKIIKENVLKAVYLAAEKSKIAIRVNTEDFDHIERLKPDLFTKFKDLKSVTVTADPSVTRGGCFLETPCGDVDASIETQLDKIWQSLERDFTARL